MVFRLDPDEEAALSVATLEDIIALSDILNALVSMTYLFYRLDPDEEAALSVATLEDIDTLASMTYLFYGVKAGPR
jgi:hypothetical protein